MCKPEFLYHYTSIEGLAHILASRAIRFSRLDLLDDVDEGGSTDEVDWRKYYFVSCWTADTEESIPLWSMYTRDMTGVRLKLPTEMFRKYLIEHEKVPKFIHIADTSSAPPGAKIILESYMPYELLHGEDYIVMPPSFGKDVWPLEVIYTDDESKLKQEILRYDPVSDRTTMSLFEVGKYKKKVWAFQKEWRFRICCYSAAPRSLADKMPEDDYYKLMISKLGSLGNGVNQEYFFMELSEQAFANAEILMGPKVDKAHELIVDALVKAYCPTISISQSHLAGTIRSRRG